MRIDRNDLPELLFKTLKAIGGEGTIIEVCKNFWNTYEQDLRDSGNLFYTWQYDIRWAATELRKDGDMKAAEESRKGVWELS